MKEFYTPAQRKLQDLFKTRALADRLAAIVSPTLADDQVAFIESRDMFFLATTDAEGFPTSSYKGGAPGFVRALSPGTLAFPSYDGNGMFMSLGNIADLGKVGLLFIDFETPQRLRVSGTAKLLLDGPLLVSYPGANAVVEVTITGIWANCPRYVHKMQRVEPAPHVPGTDGSAPFALWKRIDIMQDVLSPNDHAEAEKQGLISIHTYQDSVNAGKG